MCYGIGQLGSRSNPWFSESYTYRSSDGKLTSIGTNIAVSGLYSKSFSRTLSYDTSARLSGVQSPDGVTHTVGYNARGYATQTKWSTTVLEDVQHTDAFGSPTVDVFGNGLKTVRGYDAATGRLTSIQTGSDGCNSNSSNSFAIGIVKILGGRVIGAGPNSALYPGSEKPLPYWGYFDKWEH